MERVGRVAAGVVLAVGASVLLGWYLGIGRLTTIVPNYVSMKPNTALCLMALSLGVLSLPRLLSVLLGSGTGLLAALTLGEYLTDRSWGLDTILPGVDLGGQSPRMAVATAIALLLLSVALLAHARGRRGTSQVLAVAGFAVGYIAVLGYVYDVSSLYSLVGYTSMAVHTAGALVLLSLALLMQDPDRGLLGLVRDPGSAGRLMRPLLPFLLVGPPGLGWARLWAQRQGWVDTTIGVSLLVLSMTFFGSVLTWRAANRLRELDRERDEAQAALSQANRELESAVQARTDDLHRTAERLGTLVRLAPVGIVELSAEGGVLSGNDQWVALSGLDQDAASGSGWVAAVHPDDVERVTAEWAEAVAAGRAYETTLRFVTPAGQVNWVHARTSPVLDHGVLSGHLATLSDVSVLHAAEERFRMLMETAPDAMVGVDPQGVIRLVNAQAERLFGYTRQELLGGQIEMLVPERAREAHPALRAAFGRRPEARPMGSGIDLSARRKDGTEFPAEVSLSSLDTEDGRIITAAVRDVSERKAFEREVARARDIAERAAQARQEFLANMSHEIRTPMNAVVGMTSLLLDTDLTAEQRDFVETVRTSGDHLLTIINDILDYSKIDAGKIVLEELSFRVRDWLHESLELIAVQAHDKGLEVVSDVSEDVPVSVVGDPGRIRQILVNLLSNAVKFTAAGEVVVLMSVEPGDGAGLQLRVEVRDTGVGVEPERIPALFDPFMQADGATTRTYGGTGLGLAISRQLAERMGGSITMTSTPGEGTSVAFSVQVLPVDEKTQARQHDLLVGQRVLIVDDNATNRTILKSWTARHGMVSAVASSAAEALEVVEREDDLRFALIDLMMPGMDGGQLGELLHTRLPDCHLLLLSSAGPHAREIVARGIFAAALSKPVNQELLFTQMAGLLQPAGFDPGPVRASPRPFALATETRGLSILVVEDNPVNQKVARHLIERFGFRSDVASSGNEALDALARRDYDLVFMDVQMPDMDGLEATRRIRARWPERSVRIVAMTANVAEEDVRRCLEAGMDGFLGKPVALEELAAVLGETADAAALRRPDPPAASAAPAPGLDRMVLDALRRQIGAASLEEVVAMFLSGLDVAGPEMAAACRDRDTQSLATHAHAIKSAARLLGATHLADLLDAVEQQGSSQNWDELADWVEEVEQQRQVLHLEFADDRHRLT